MKNMLNLTWLFERRFVSECDLILKIYQSDLNKEKLLKYLKLGRYKQQYYKNILLK